MGLWWFADDVRAVVGDLSEEEICEITLNIIYPLLLENKLFPVTLFEDGSYSVWKEGAETTIARIRREWLDLGREPTIDDIVWFVGMRGDKG